MDRAITVGITQLRKELGGHTKGISELEHHMSDIDDKVQNSFTSEQQSKEAQQYILDKLDDLEN